MTIEITEQSEGVQRTLLRRVVSRYGISYRGEYFSARFLRDHQGRVVLIDGGPTGSSMVDVYSQAGTFIGAALNVAAGRQALQRLVSATPSGHEIAQRPHSDRRR